MSSAPFFFDKIRRETGRSDPRCKRRGDETCRNVYAERVRIAVANVWICIKKAINETSENKSHRLIKKSVRRCV